MKNLKGWITTLALVMTLMSSTAFAEGVIIGGRGNNQPCTSQEKVAVDYGVIIIGFAGEIIASLTGVILDAKTGVIIGGKGATAENCGSVIGG